ncbi:hypothetical protein SLE2022_057080 [Rubroshorea leprosula]
MGRRSIRLGCVSIPCILTNLARRQSSKCRDIVKHWQDICRFKNIQFSHQQQEKVEEAVDGFMNFESRKEVLNNIMKALQSASINTVAVYGEDGIGKTKLVREIKRRAKEVKLFDAIVMATVRMNPDLPRIQDEIAYGLGLHRVSNEHTSQQAFNLGNARLTEKKDVFVILEDVWEPEMYSKLRERLPLIDEKQNSLSSYKILLTSTDRAVLFNLSEEQFEIHPLKEKEDWELLKKIAINRYESIPLPFYANEEIVKKCNKLRIAVATLAKALKSRIQ